MRFEELLKTVGIVKALENGQVVRFLGQWKISNTYLKDTGNGIVGVYNQDNQFAAPFMLEDSLLNEEVEILDSEPAWSTEDRAAYAVWISSPEYKEQTKFTLSFGEAVDLMKQGLRVARVGWNGKGMFLYYVPEGKYPARMDAIKGVFEDDMVPYGAYIAMKTAQGNVVPWLASQSDMLSEDYVLVQ